MKKIPQNSGGSSQSLDRPPRWFHLRPRFIIGLAIVLLPLFIVAWWFHLPSGSGPAGPPVPAEPFQSTWRTGRVLLVGFGDSITRGFGAGGEGLSLFERLVKTPEQDPDDMRGKDLSAVFPGLETLNLAEDATSSKQHLYVQIPRLDPQPPEVFGVVVITTGGIDLIHDYGRSPPHDGAIYGATYEQGEPWGIKFRERLEGMLDEIKSKFPGGCQIFLANIYDPTDGVGDIENVHPLLRIVFGFPPWPDGERLLTLWNRHLREAADARDFVHLVDIHVVMLGHGMHCTDDDNPHYHEDDPTHWYYMNLEDPNSRGYDAVRRMFLLEMIEVLHGR